MTFWQAYWIHPTIHLTIKTCNCWYPDQQAYSLFITSMRSGPRHWRARGHREPTWSFSKVFFKFLKCFVSSLFQFFFLVLWIYNGYLWWYLWVDSASCMIKRFVVVFIVTDIMYRHSPLHHGNDRNLTFNLINILSYTCILSEPNMTLKIGNQS